MKTNRSTIIQPELIVDSRNGIYTPKTWLESVSGQIKKQLTPEQRADLRNPEGGFYWETWEEVLNKEFKVNRQKGHFEQTEGGDIFFIPNCYRRSKGYKESFNQ